MLLIQLEKINTPVFNQQLILQVVSKSHWCM